MEHAITQDLVASAAGRARELKGAVEEVEFPIGLRGYDRNAVDAYVRRTGRLIAELRAAKSPDAAVQQALEQVGEEVAGILRRAHEAAEQITAQSRSEADDRLQQARREAQEITVGARVRLRDLDADTDRIWAERHRIIEDARSLAVELAQLAELAAERFPAGEEPAVEAEETLVLDDGAKAGDRQTEPPSDDDRDEQLGMAEIEDEEPDSAVVRISSSQQSKQNGDASEPAS